ncbi:transposase [Dyadobacter luteus]|uniref:transposase n=1 Tax=Dyadobacter luteus TaxID=2259619 RepID=UPI001314F7B3|nr:transposase [Dyadobacter luteus]
MRNSKKICNLRSDFPDSAIFFHDELRAGTRTELSRKWAPTGHRPIAPVKIGYENTYLYLTICPFNGKGFATFLPKLDSASFGWFIQKVEDTIAQKSLFIADGAKAHKEELFNENKLVFKKLPPACPELNPIERFFKEVRKHLKNRVFESLKIAQTKIEEIVEKISESAYLESYLRSFKYFNRQKLSNRTSEMRPPHTYLTDVI